MARKCGRCAGAVDKDHYFCESCRRDFDRINRTPITRKPKNSRNKKVLFGCLVM